MSLNRTYNLLAPGHPCAPIYQTTYAHHRAMIQWMDECMKATTKVLNVIQPTLNGSHEPMMQMPNSPIIHDHNPPAISEAMQGGKRSSLPSPIMCNVSTADLRVEEVAQELVSMPGKAQPTKDVSRTPGGPNKMCKRSKTPSGFTETLGMNFKVNNEQIEPDVSATCQALRKCQTTSTALEEKLSMRQTAQNTQHASATQSLGLDLPQSGSEDNDE